MRNSCKERVCCLLAAEYCITWLVQSCLHKGHHQKSLLFEMHKNLIIWKKVKIKIRQINLGKHHEVALKLTPSLSVLEPQNPIPTELCLCFQKLWSALSPLITSCPSSAPFDVCLIPWLIIHLIDHRRKLPVYFQWRRAVTLPFDILIRIQSKIFSGLITSHSTKTRTYMNSYGQCR